MHNFFKDTIPKGENFKRRILIKLKMNVTVVHRCFSKLNLWVKFSCPILNNKVNIANVRVVFSTKNIFNKIKSNTIKNVLWWILLQYFKNAKFLSQTFSIRAFSCVSFVFAWAPLSSCPTHAPIYWYQIKFHF